MKKYLRTRLLLVSNVVFWLLLYGGYMRRFMSGDEISASTVIISVLLFVDIIGYLLFIWLIKFKSKLISIALVSFLIVNALLCVTDQFGLMDMMALGLNLGTLLIYFIEMKHTKNPYPYI